MQKDSLGGDERPRRSLQPSLLDTSQLPHAVARWRFGWLTVKWPNGVHGVFVSWNAALFCLIGDVPLRIRP